MSDLLPSPEHRDVKISYQDARLLKTEATWQSMENRTVAEAIEHWLVTLRGHTQSSYLSGMNRLTELGLIDPTQSLQQFALTSHNVVVDRIKLVDEWSECTRQARAACYIAFTRWLARLSEGVIPRAEPNRDGTDKTFYKVREKVATEAMTKAQWFLFFEELEKINLRDALIGKIALQGGKRIGEVLGLTFEHVEPDKRQIRFHHSKTKGLFKETVITYSNTVWNELETYLAGRNEGLVFLTGAGKQVHRSQVYRSFVKAGRRAGIPFKVTPHVLRASCVTYLKGLGFGDSDIMAITGHARPEMVHAYDRRDTEDNVSKDVQLI